MPELSKLQLAIDSIIETRLDCLSSQDYIAFWNRSTTLSEQRLWMRDYATLVVSPGQRSGKSVFSILTKHAVDLPIMVRDQGERMEIASTCKDFGVLRTIITLTDLQTLCAERTLADSRGVIIPMSSCFDAEDMARVTHALICSSVNAHSAPKLLVSLEIPGQFADNA